MWKDFKHKNRTTGPSSIKGFCDCVCFFKKRTFFRVRMICAFFQGFSFVPLTVTISTRTDQSKVTSFSRSGSAGEHIYWKPATIELRMFSLQPKLKRLVCNCLSKCTCHKSLHPHWNWDWGKFTTVRVYEIHRTVLWFEKTGDELCSPEKKEVTRK